jgi:hypothetical protein
LPEPGYKRCRSCGETKPLAAFNAHKCKSDGCRSWCRECEQEARAGSEAALARRRRRQTSLQQRRLAAALALATGRKTCAGPCGRELPLDKFWRRKDSLDGHAHWCTECGEKRRRRPDPVDRERWERWEAARAEFDEAVARSQAATEEERP